MEKTCKAFTCSMELTLDLIGGKWKPILIYHIGHNKQIRYGELKRIIPQINERVLSRELKELEARKVIIRTEFPEKILRVEYQLTPEGEEVLPILDALTQWGNKYNQKHQYATVECQ